MKLFRVTPLLLCCCWFNALYGQSNQYVFSQITISNGLSNNHITCFFKDARGFMWFGTESGLNRYDGFRFRVYSHRQQDTGSIADNYINHIFEGPGNRMWVETAAGRFNIFDAATEKFDHDYAAYLKKMSLPDGLVSTIVKGKNSFWFVYPDTGLFHYLPNGTVIAVKHVQNDNNSISADRIADVKANPQGDVWVIHENGLVEKVDGTTNKVVYRTDILQKKTGNAPVAYSMFADSDEGLWIYSGGLLKGVFYLNTATNSLSHLSQESNEGRLNSNFIFSIIQDESGLMWIATDHGGINIIDKKNFSVKTIMHSDPVDNKSLPENSVSVIFKDNLNIIWLGTSKSGICYYHENIIKFPQYRHQPAKPGSLSYNDINSFASDAADNLWIGSNGGGLIYFNRGSNTFRQYLHNSGDGGSLSTNIITSLLLDRSNKLWIGTYFGGLDCYNGKTFTHYRHSDSEPGSLADDRVMSMYEDDSSNLWVGTLGQGIDKFDRQKNIFIHHKSGGGNSITNNYISSIAADKENKLWIGTAYGIDVLDKTSGKFTHYSSDNNGLSTNNVTCLYKDSAGRMWVGTREGLNLFNPESQQFQIFKTPDGLTDNIIRSIVEDNKHDLWVGTANGITNLHLLPGKQAGQRMSCKKYDEQDGLQGREFNERASVKMRSGELVFGGPGGFNIFKPASIFHTPANSSIVFTDLLVFNESVQVGVKSGGHVILKTAISETGEIMLKYNENVFSIEFASLNFINPGKCKYAYRMEGFNNTWLATDGNLGKASFTNLDPGHYVLRVKVSDEDGVWNQQEAALKIIILPPYWKTNLAYFIYLLAVLAILYLARHLVIRGARMRFMLENERQEAQRMHSLDMVKIRFFTNMSHELRTPLSLILAPVDKLLNAPVEPALQKQYELIRRNARRLLNLVNQLLDFRKMEVNELKLHATQGDVLKFIKETVISFTDLAEKKNIAFSYCSDAGSLITLFDHDKIERILFNLLSNAFKFTPENGVITVHVATTYSPHDKVLLEIKVADNGIGISKDSQEKIFERFFQTEVPANMLNQGSGIGLAITREFVKMHNGSITVNSGPGKGTCFTLLLPFKEIKALQTMAPADEPAALPQTDGLPLPEVQGASVDIQPVKQLGNDYDAKKSTILLVEDNDDFRFYLKDNLQAFYNIVEAANGQEGWQKVLALHPELVVSDISMPVMDGLTFCIKIKADQRTRQIPVILLTAFAGEGQELKGLESGASDYLTKPFNFEILLSKLRNLLAYKETIKKTYQKQVQVNQADIEFESTDVKFIQSVLDLIEKNMANHEFSVEELSHNLFMSRTTVYKKLLSLTGKTPVEFIRHVRLKRGAMLLEKSQKTVTEIAYEVGFINPKYFAKCFKAEFSVIPSVYAAEKRHKDRNI